MTDKQQQIADKIKKSDDILLNKIRCWKAYDERFDLMNELHSIQYTKKHMPSDFNAKEQADVDIRHEPTVKRKIKRDYRIISKDPHILDFRQRIKRGLKLLDVAKPASKRLLYYKKYNNFSDFDDPRYPPLLINDLHARIYQLINYDLKNKECFTVIDEDYFYIYSELVDLQFMLPKVVNISKKMFCKLTPKDPRYYLFVS